MRIMCSEPHHTKGSSAKPCRLCSLPVCEGCIVKASIAKHEVTLQMCRVHYCVDCWISGNPQRERRPPESVPRTVPRVVRADDPNSKGESCCVCSAQDKWLCLKCKSGQRSLAQSRYVRCAGHGCSRLVQPGDQMACICLLCGLYSPQGREKSRREYDSIHLSARLYSAWDPDASLPDSCMANDAEASQPSRIVLEANSEPRYFPIVCQEAREADENQSPKTDTTTSSGPRYSQLRNPPETAEMENPKTERMKVLKTILKTTHNLRGRPRFLHTRKAVHRGYSRI